MYLVHLYADGRVKIEPLHYGYGSYLSDRGYLFTSPGKIQKNIYPDSYSYVTNKASEKEGIDLAKKAVAERINVEIAELQERIDQLNQFKRSQGL